jgi:hypothetical protein
LRDLVTRKRRLARIMSPVLFKRSISDGLGDDVSLTSIAQTSPSNFKHEIRFVLIVVLKKYALN